MGLRQRGWPAPKQHGDEMNITKVISEYAMGDAATRYKRTGTLYGKHSVTGTAGDVVTCYIVAAPKTKNGFREHWKLNGKVISKKKITAMLVASK